MNSFGGRINVSIELTTEELKTLNFSAYLDLKRSRNYLEEFISSTVVKLKEMDDVTEYYPELTPEVADALNFTGIASSLYFTPDLELIEDRIQDEKDLMDKAIERHLNNVENHMLEKFANENCALIGKNAYEISDYRRLMKIGEDETVFEDEEFLKELLQEETVN